MKSVLNISKRVDVGSRFNNFALRSGFLQYGWDPQFASWEHPKSHEREISAVENRFNRLITKFKSDYSRLTGNIDGNYCNSRYFTSLDSYKNADLLHFHIVHERYLSLKDWLRISNKKPVVWTWHDPYPMHGHCIYSLGCMKFVEGCQKCPHLDYHFSILRDRSSKNLFERIRVIEQIDPLVIVASSWMYEKIMESQFRGKIRVQVLPFGVTVPEGELSQAEAKLKLGIPPENIVFGFRAIESKYKGLDLIMHAIDKLRINFPNIPVTFITFEKKDLFIKRESNFQIIELGWVKGEEIHQYYPALDYFLMPSKAEAFGLMAVEAMMHGVFPLVTHGTALESLLPNWSEPLVCMHEKDAFYNLVVSSILKHNKLTQNRGGLKSWALEKYSAKNFLEKLTYLYSEEYARFYHN